MVYGGNLTANYWTFFDFNTQLVSTALAPQWCHQHPVNSIGSPVSSILQAQFKRLMFLKPSTLSRAKQVVKPWDDVAVVAVCVGTFTTVMHAVEIRSYQHFVEDAVQFWWQTHIGVGEGVQENTNDLVGKGNLEGNSQQRNYRQQNGHKHEGFQWVVTQIGTDVHINIGVVNSVQAPEPGYSVKGDVGQVSNKLQCHKQGEQWQPEAGRKLVKQSESVHRRPVGQQEYQDYVRQADAVPGNYRQPQIVAPAPGDRCRRASARPEHFSCDGDSEGCTGDYCRNERRLVDEKQPVHLNDENPANTAAVSGNSACGLSER